MKKAIIIHCWEGYPEYCWYQKTKSELEAKGFQVEVPAMPDTENPKQATWVPKLTKVVGQPNEDVYLIGHSVGCITILRYLESLKDDQKIGGLVFVAGFSESLGEGYEEIDNFFERPVDFELIKTKAKHFVAINSVNDPHVDLRFGRIFEDNLDAKLITKEGMYHFSGAIEEEPECSALPEVANEIALMSS